MSHNHEIAKGAAALLLNAVALLTSAQEHFEFWLRCTSLSVGTIVGVITIYSFIQKRKKRSH